MTNGDLFVPRKPPREFRQGNPQQNVYPLDDKSMIHTSIDPAFHQILGEAIDLNTVHDVRF